MHIDQLKPHVVVRGPLFPEPVQVIVTIPMGSSVKLVGKGLTTGQVHEPILTAEQLAQLEASPEKEPFDGDPHRFRLGIEALRLGLAYEYDPYFSLSIARVDPLPHQLEAVYDYFLKLPRIRFLLADDPGAGKTIMAGLLLKELKIRGLVTRTLIVTPANLSFQWQREMQDKFREHFEIIRGDVLRANYGSNPWQEKPQVVTSISWVSVIEDAKDSLLRSHWDLIIVDEAHKMSAYSADKKTLAYQLGEALSTMTDHYLLMTATPHKGDPQNFCLFLELLDRDVYGDVKSLEEAMRRNSAPFYLRRTKEALVSFPDQDTGQVKPLFTTREVRTVEFLIDDEEWDFYDALTRYVEDQSIKAAADESARGRALLFTMAMLQRRFASSIYAARRSLERMREKRQRILEDPGAYRQDQLARKIPDDFDELPEDEQQEIIAALEAVVASVDPMALREEILQLTKLIEKARMLEQREVESKLSQLKQVITDQGMFTDPDMKLLLFTEHKDTLDYLIAKLRQWGLRVTQIHGGMKIGDRDMPGTRLAAEREFRDEAQVLVATEAAGEGINLQFCWFLINYDIPWNPVRLEQRMGRIHRYGQEHDCLILNFVAINTREGRVLQRLLERLREIRQELGTDQVFDVVGEIFPANLLERLFRDMYARRISGPAIEARIVRDVDAKRFRAITQSTLEGLAKRELNLATLIGKSAEARERRLVPEVVEDFFLQAAPLAGIYPKETRANTHLYRIGRVPRTLWPIGERLEPRFGKLGREYRQVVFDKTLLARDVTSEWITPGHPLFEAVREEVLARVRDDLQRGAVFYDLHRQDPYELDVFSAAIKDGRGNALHRRLFVVQSDLHGTLTIRQPTIFLDLALAPKGTTVPGGESLPDRHATEQALIEHALGSLLTEVAAERARETETVLRHVEISLNELIHRQNLKLGELVQQQEQGETSPLLAANLRQAENRVDELVGRLERRREELQQERQCMIDEIQDLGRAWVLPHPERSTPGIAPMVQDEQVERIAVESVMAYEEARGWQVESVERDNRGFDLISRRPHPEDPKTALEVRFIEVKGRAAVGEVALTNNEYKTAERLKQDYWLYVVFNCASTPQVHVIQNPILLEWESLVRIEHYHVGARTIFERLKGKLMSYKPRTLFRLIEEINTELFLPHIQRPFVWDEEQMRRLFDSLMCNYPIQTFLFWRTKDGIKTRKFMQCVEWDAVLSDLYEKNKSDYGIEKTFVLDGQQRLQTLYALFNGNIKSSDGKRSLEGWFDIISGETQHDDGLLYRVIFSDKPLDLPMYRLRDLLRRHSQKNAFEIADDLNDELDTILGESPPERNARRRRVNRNISQLVSLLREDKYFWIEELDGVANDYPYKRVLDIFVRINSGGTKLDAADLMFAAMKENWEDIEQNIEEVVGMLNNGKLSFDNTVVLKSIVVALGRGPDLDPVKFSSSDGEKLLQKIHENWSRIESTFNQLRDFITNTLQLYADKVVRSYNSFAPLFDYLYHNPNPEIRDIHLMVGYYYKSQLFNWYARQTDGIISAMHSIVGLPKSQGFPINDVKLYFGSRGYDVELHPHHLMDIRLRFILLNLIYVSRFGSSPFNVRYKGNEPHIDHIYPQTPLRRKLELSTDEINHLGNYRYIGANENLRKRAEQPSEYFGRLKSQGAPVENHLLVAGMSGNPSLLSFDVNTYREFRDRRLEAIFEIATKVVNPELT